MGPEQLPAGTIAAGSGAREKLVELEVPTTVALAGFSVIATMFPNRVYEQGMVTTLDTFWSVAVNVPEVAVMDTPLRTSTAMDAVPVTVMLVKLVPAAGRVLDLDDPLGG